MDRRQELTRLVIELRCWMAECLEVILFLVGVERRPCADRARRGQICSPSWVRSADRGEGRGGLLMLWIAGLCIGSVTPRPLLDQRYLLLAAL
jgi:hypothetical protein